MFNKCNGSLTGWISYTYTHATRTFSAIKQMGHYPASHERPHELNAVATYTLNRHWSFGATFVYASGFWNTFHSSRQHQSYRQQPDDEIWRIQQ